MSSQKGNVTRNRPQKHRNKTAFKNNLHDTSGRTKFINSLQVSDVCNRCKEIIEWKIKYKKYKPLSQPKNCVKCKQRTVKKAYHVMCVDCGNKLGICMKCCQSKEVVRAEPSEKEQLKLDSEMKTLLQSLPERKRRTFIRYMNRKKEIPECETGSEENERDDLMNKLNALKVDNEDDLFDEDDDLDDYDLDDEDGIENENRESEN